MDKVLVNQLLPHAVEAWKESVAVDDKIPKVFRSYISNFGAAVATGSLLAAVAYISADTGNKTKARRENLPVVLLKTLQKAKVVDKTYSRLFDYVVANQESRQTKTDIMSAAIAVKLALNVFELTGDGQAQND